MSDASLTAQQNLVQAFNNNTRAAIYNAGQFTSDAYSGPGSWLIAAGATNQGSTSSTIGYGSGSGTGGRLVSISVVAGGTGTISFYNSASASVTPTRNLLVVITDPAVGIQQIGKQFTAGLVMVITGNLAANATYSLG
jgi:transcription elongation factor